MTCGKCARCGTEDSMFWYPYAFGMAPIPDIAGRIGMDRSQYFNLCDKCQQEFTDFMHNKRWPFFDADKLKEMMDAEPMPIIVPNQEAKK